ncbi:MAG TPA: hypothetical protein VE422_30880 [Terriglobia bacterium]|nr:hypothetical protein [Terriglobia bacterium]
MSPENREGSVPFYSEPAADASPHVNDAKEPKNGRERTPTEEDALTYLIETRRAQTAEEAERYLETLNQVKEKLVCYAKDELQRRNAKGFVSSSAPRIEFEWEGRDADPDTLNINQIDRTFPQVWLVYRGVSPHYAHFLPEDRRQGGMEYKEDLEIDLGQGKVTISPDFGGLAAHGLKKYLSPEDLKFLVREYTFALQDLRTEIEALLKRVDAQRDFHHPGWEELETAGIVVNESTRTNS